MSTMVLFYLILTLVNIIPIDSSLRSCRQTFGANKYDLNKLDHLTLSGGDTQFRYLLTPCGLVPADKCGKSPAPLDKGITSCQERIATSSFESAMGYLDGYGKSPNLEFKENPQGPGTGVVMTMRNAKCNMNKRLVKITFICDTSITNPTTMDVKENPTCQFDITVKAAGACPIKEGGVSGGTVFIIILLVLVIVYLLGGILYNRFKEKQTGLAVLPHPGFWLLIVGLALTGCRFCINSIRNCFQGNSATSSGKYESV
ncbi:unnamed protein product [Adineta steineri]|uniref:Autophagy-related protein 27 n=1 Tax=Adineta steineri TaxID=433720 RepID=A0A815Q532_9BILA|nr:unnamed protein product [Adineta steineri]